MTKFLILILISLTLASCTPKTESTFFCATPVGLAQGKGRVKAHTADVTTESGAKIRIDFSNCVEVYEEPK